MSSNFTRMTYGAWYKSDAYLGGLNGGAPGFDGEIANATTFVSDLSHAKDLGARLSIKVVGPATGYGKGSAFSLGAWKAKFDEAVARTSASQMSAFFADGTLIGHMMLDDLGASGAFSKEPTFAEIDEMARYSKSKWSIPTSVRIHGSYLKSIVTQSQYSYLDYCWNQWHKRYGAVGPWYITNTNDARSVGLGSMQGFNLLNGGSGITAPWNVSGDNLAGSFGCSPQEIDAIGNAFSAVTASLGIMPWAHQNNAGDSNYWDMTSIQTALTALFSRAIGKVIGPFNWRGDLAGSSSGTTQGSVDTQTGNWGVIQVADDYTRTADAASLSVPLPTGAGTGQALCILTYSRDNTFRTAVAPSGFSEAARVSGNSAQGGELCLFIKKLAAPPSGNQIIDFTGPGGAGSAGGSMMGRSFAVSGVTTGTIICGVGSDSSWPNTGSDMGPVKGKFTSTVSDALVLVCAAKANDFGGGSIDVPPDTMSITTNAGETWSRLFILANGAGSDSGMFCDYTFTSGLLSIDTKSWSQNTTATNATAGAGCGFFVALAPVSIVSGQPPVMSEFVDWTVSTGSDVSFRVVSTGSTPITYSKVSAPSTATFGSSTGQFTFTPTSAGTYFITLRATNSFGSDTQSLFVFANTPSSTSTGGVGGGTNHAPDITNPGDKTVAAHDLLSFLVDVNDVDGDPITMAMQSAPAGAFLDSMSGQFVWIPNGHQGPGVYPIVIIASDGQTESRSTFTVTVTDTRWTRYGGPSNQLAKISTTSNSFTRIR